MSDEERKRVIKIAQDFFNKHQLTMECNIEAKEFQAFYHILLDYQKLQKENENQRKKLLRQYKILHMKDKQINSMAEFINKQDVDEDICKNNISDLCDEYGTGINCIKCIKQHFKELAKEKGE